jgi:hypothetical protein
MIRFNTTLGALEYYTTTVGWRQLISEFTVIADEQFSGDGVTTVYTIATPQTTSSCIVSINGVIQIPTLAYAVSGTTLTFTEAPLSGDIIDVRKLTTTQTVELLSSDNGHNIIRATNAGIELVAGTVGETLQLRFDTTGTMVNVGPTTAIAAANVATVVATFDATAIRSAHIMAQASATGKFQVQEALVIHDGTTATIIEYGVINTAGNAGVLSATLTGSVLTVEYTAAQASTTVRVNKTGMAI